MPLALHPFYRLGSHGEVCWLDVARTSSIARDLHRRRLLKQLAGGVVVATAGSLLPVRALRATGTSPTASVVRPGKVLELAELLRTTPRERVFAVAAAQVRSGATYRELLGGTLLAGIQDVKPRPAGTKFHVVLVVASSLELTEASPAEDRFVPAFFNIHTLKNSQERDIQEGDWFLPAAPETRIDSPEQARRALTFALEDWDELAADRAATAAARLLERDELFELLWPYGARCYRNIGHKMIHTSQIYRGLAMLDGHHREPVVRSLVYSLLWGGPGETTESYEVCRQRLDELPADWQGGRRDADVAIDWMRRLRTLNRAQALDLALEQLRSGISPDSIWDGMRLAGSEILFRLRQSDVRNAQLLGVHPLTTLNAFHFAYTRTDDERTRRLLLLQAVAWMPAFRDDLKRLKDLSMEAPGFDRLAAPGDPVDLQQAVRAADGDYVDAASQVLRATEQRGQGDRYVDVCRDLVLRKSLEHHNHKYAVAAFEEYRKADPAIAPYLLATCLSYLPTPDADESPIYRATREALQ